MALNPYHTFFAVDSVAKYPFSRFRKHEDETYRVLGRKMEIFSRVMRSHFIDRQKVRIELHNVSNFSRNFNQYPAVLPPAKASN